MKLLDKLNQMLLEQEELTARAETLLKEEEVRVSVARENVAKEKAKAASIKQRITDISEYVAEMQEAFEDFVLQEADREGGSNIGNFQTFADKAGLEIPIGLIESPPDEEARENREEEAA